MNRRAFVSATGAALAATTARSLEAMPAERRFDPWIEVDPDALRANAREVARVAGGRPVLAVVKNNAYGLGLEFAGPVLDAAPEVAGLAVVKGEEARALRRAGVRKSILVMAAVEDDEAVELVRSDVRLAPFDDAAGARLSSIARRAGRVVHVHPDIDTGMNRVGMPVARAAEWIAGLARNADVRIEGMFTTLAEDDTFDVEQHERFIALGEAVRSRGIDVGRMHEASSHALFFRQAALLDMVRPGLALFGAYPSGAQELRVASLRPAFRLHARVVRVERLEAGAGVSYGRNYVAERPTWIATLPVGHADGYPRNAVRGCEVLIGDGRYRVIGAVSASHTIVEVGAQKSVEVGDLATLVGAEEAIHPNTIAQRAGISVYDVLMHLSTSLPRRIVQIG